MQQRLPSLLAEPIGFAHRGARAHARENTIDAFALALRLGANGLESDVWLTADGIPVLDHDGVLRRGVRRKGITATPRAALPTHIPSLSDLLARCGSSYHLSLDLKDPRAGSAVIDVVAAEAPDLLERLWLCAPSYQALLPLRGRGAKLVESTRLERIKEGPERRAALLATQGIDAMNMHHTDWNGGLVALFHRFELLAFGWDMQHPHVLRPALRMGLDAVYSDWVDRLVDAFTEEVGGIGRV